MFTIILQVLKLYAWEPSFEEQILKMHDEKRDLVDGVLSGADAAAKLSTKELADLIRMGVDPSVSKS